MNHVSLRIGQAVSMLGSVVAKTKLQHRNARADFVEASDMWMETKHPLAIGQRRGACRENATNQAVAIPVQKKLRNRSGIEFDGSKSKLLPQITLYNHYIPKPPISYIGNICEYISRVNFQGYPTFPLDKIVTGAISYHFVPLKVIQLCIANLVQKITG